MKFFTYLDAGLWILVFSAVVAGLWYGLKLRIGQKKHSLLSISINGLYPSYQQAKKDRKEFDAKCDDIVRRHWATLNGIEEAAQCERQEGTYTQERADYYQAQARAATEYYAAEIDKL